MLDETLGGLFGRPANETQTRLEYPPRLAERIVEETFLFQFLLLFVFPRCRLEAGPLVARFLGVNARDGLWL